MKKLFNALSGFSAIGFFTGLLAYTLLEISKYQALIAPDGQPIIENSQLNLSLFLIFGGASTSLISRLLYLRAERNECRQALKVIKPPM